LNENFLSLIKRFHKMTRQILLELIAIDKFMNYLYKIEKILIISSDKRLSLVEQNVILINAIFESLSIKEL